MTHPWTTVYSLYNTQADYVRRLHASQTHWADEGLYPKLWRAPDSTAWGLASTLSCPHTPTKCPMAPWAVCCLLGHYTLWQHLAALDGDSALVLEDDTMLVSGFIARASAAIESAPPFDLLFLGSTEVHKHTRTGGPAGYGKYLYPFGTHCYYVRRAALPILLNTMSQAESPVDLQLYDRAYEKLNYYVCEPSLAGQWTHSPD